jgi:hypothetical protein
MKVTEDDGKQCRLVFGTNILIPRNRAQGVNPEWTTSPTPLRTGTWRRVGWRRSSSAAVWRSRGVPRPASRSRTQREWEYRSADCINDRSAVRVLSDDDQRFASDPGRGLSHADGLMIWECSATAASEEGSRLCVAISPKHRSRWSTHPGKRVCLHQDLGRPVAVAKLNGPPTCSAAGDPDQTPGTGP